MLTAGSATAATPGWEVLVTPNPGTGHNVFADVSGVSGTEVWAVGRYEVKPHVPTYPVAARWDGGGWRQTAVPVPAGKNNVELAAVTAIRVDDVWAVGSAGTTSDLATITLITHWDGRSWTRVSTPNDGAVGTWLTDVAVSPTGEVYATGDVRWRTWAGSLTRKAAVMRYDGTAWNYLHVPSFDIEGTSVGDVAVGPAGDVWLTGSSRTGEGFARLAGGTWQLIAGADPAVWAGPAHEALTITGGRVWMVGSYIPARGDLNSRTYAERSPAL